LKSKTSRGRKRNVPARTKRKSLGVLNWFKRKINLISIWILVAVNAVLISSLVQKLITPMGIPPVTSVLNDEPLRVEVRNGCGRHGLANQFAEFLKRQECEIIDVGNAQDFNYDHTVLIVRTSPDDKKIKDLRNALGLEKDRVLPITNEEARSDLTLIIGADYDQLKAYRSMQ
jgi:hypothetical protein